MQNLASTESLNAPVTNSNELIKVEDNKINIEIGDKPEFDKYEANGGSKEATIEGQQEDGGNPERYIPKIEEDKNQSIDQDEHRVRYQVLHL
jgi:hypothetical protein